jgi:hypothetical protein
MLKRILTATVLAALRSIGVVRATPGSGCAVSPSFCVTPVARYTTDASIKIQAPGLGKVEDLFEEFCDEFTREMNRLRMEHRASLSAAEREIDRIEARRRKLIEMVMEGVPPSGER